MTKKKAALQLLFFACGQSLGGCFAILVAETLDTSTHGVHRFLGASVERVRFT
jgi:hypothetical protein